MGGKFKFQVQDSDLAYLFWRFEKLIALSEKKLPLVWSLEIKHPLRKVISSNKILFREYYRPYQTIPQSVCGLTNAECEKTAFAIDPAGANSHWVPSNLKIKRKKNLEFRNGILLPKLFWPTVRKKKCSKAKSLQLKLIHIFARAISLMKKLEIEKTKPTFIISVLKVVY